MPIQLFPQLNLGSAHHNSVGRAMDDGIGRAIQLEQLGKLRKEREDEEKATVAMKNAVKSKSTTYDSATDTTTVDEGGFDKYAYADELEKNVSPEAAMQYRAKAAEHDLTVARLDEQLMKNKEAEELKPLSDKIRRISAMTKGMDYYITTGDVKGALGFFNEFEDPKDRTVDLKMLPNNKVLVTQADGDKFPWDLNNMQALGVDDVNQQREWNEMIRHKEDLALRKQKENEKNNKPKVAKQVGPEQRKQEMVHLTSLPELEELADAELGTLAVDVGKAMNHMEQEYVNRGEQPPSPETRREQVLGQLMDPEAPLIVPVEKGMFNDKPAMYLNSGDKVYKARQSGRISKQQYDNLLRKYYPEMIEKIKQGKLK